MRIKKSSFLLFAIVFGFVMQLASCKKADIKFGEEFITDNEMQVFRVDSFSTQLSTVFQDSFITSSKGNIMIGGYTDPLFGRVETQSYFEVAPPVWADVYQNSFFDSLTLILNTNGTFYGDTTKPVTIVVKELLDSIAFPENKFAFYNTTSFAAKSIPLTTFTGYITPLSNQKISIRLPDVLGNNLLALLKDVNENPIKSVTKFLNYFRGFQLSTTSGTELLANCNSGAIMRLHYKQSGFTPLLEKTVDFPLAYSNHQFNHISIARTGAIQSLGSSNREILSENTNNAAYGQSTTGSLIKLSFPTLKGISQLPKFAKLLKATLIIKPVKGTYNDLYTLPPTLRLSKTDINSTIGSDLAYITNTGSIAVQLGGLQIDNLTGDKTQYQYDLTQYVNTVMNSPNPVAGEGLILSAPSPNFENQFNRVVIGNNSNSLGKMQLQIYYATVK